MSVNNGLTHSSVYSIYQDNKGYMWFGTPNGLCRYDGDHFQSYQLQDVKNSEVNNFVRGKILEDLNGNMWFTNEKGVFKWDKISEKINLIWGRNLLEHNSVDYYALVIDESRFIWMFNIQAGLIKFDLTTSKISKFPFPFKINLGNLINNYIEPGPDRKIWLKLGDEKAIMRCFDLKTCTFSTPKDYKNVNAIFFDQDQKMLVYKNKIEIANSKNDTSIVPYINKIQSNINFKSGIKDHYGRWWLTSANGLTCFNENQQTFTQFFHDNLKLNSLPFDLTTCLNIDRTNNLWIGTDGGGVARLDLKQPRFYIFPLSMGDFPILKDYFTKCFFEDDQQRIWFGTYSSGLNIYDPEKGTLLNFKNDPHKKNSLPGNIIGAIFQDKDKNKWIGTNAGLAIFDEEKKSFKKVFIKNYVLVAPDLGSFINKIIQLKNGNLLCATTRGVLSVKRNQRNVFNAEFSPNLFGMSGIDLIQLNNGNIYVGQTTGVLQLRCTGESVDSINHFLNGFNVKSISGDLKNENFLWIATNEGLVHYNIKSDSYLLYNQNNGLSDNHLYGELEDSAGNLWISSNKGLSYFNTHKKTFENFSHLNGLQSNEFNTQAFYKGASGNFYFGGVNGFNWFKANLKSPIKTKPQAAITTIEIDNQAFIKDSNYILHHLIEVPYYQNDFNFIFSALDYTLPQANKMQYILEGWDPMPIITVNKSARYSNLPPGNYTLKLMVSNAEGVWSDPEIIDIRIKAPFWKTPPFFVVISIFILLLAIYLTYLLLKRKEEKRIRVLENQVAINAERLRISADMHDEIGSSITQIALLSELVQTQHRSDLKKEMQIISSTSHRLVQTISEIIWALNPQNDTLENLLAYIREQSQQYFEPFDKEFQIDFPEEVPSIKLTNEMRRNLYLITKELLNNALKHSNATCIQLSFRIIDKELRFMVSDNGSGINEEKTRADANGMKNLRKRINDIGGTISWLNKTQGTQVNYSMPLNNYTTFFTFDSTA
ncbi:MAG: hypothetical protein JSS98_08590 [Bacteroidetes bacterium]|nr:hypothetical protein [Bacteroidota bacterium]